MFFVLDLDDSDSGKPPKGKTERKPLDLDVPEEEQAKPSGKSEGKLEILREPDSTYRRRRESVDPVRARKRRAVFTVILVLATAAALAFIGLQFLNKKPTFQEARDATLPVRPAPIVRPDRPQGPRPVLPNSNQPNPITTMPGLAPGGEVRDTENPNGGIH